MHRRGFTLIEVMLSLLLASAVVGVTGVVAVQSVQVQRSARQAIFSQWQTVRIVGQIESDVESAITWLPGDVTPVTPAAAPGELLRVYGLADAPASASLGRYRLPARIQYLIEDVGNGNGTKRLVRKVRDLTRAAPAARRVLSENLADAYVEVRKGKTWSRPVGLSKGNEDVQALRLVLRFVSQPDRAVTRTFLLPGRQTERRAS